MIEIKFLDSVVVGKESPNLGTIMWPAQRVEAEEQGLKCFVAGKAAKKKLCAFRSD